MKSRLAKLFLRLAGWTLEGKVPVARGYVLVAAPHTTNWDLLFLLAAAWSFRVELSWMGKHALFVGPMGPVMRALGGIPVRRDRPGGLVGEMARAFAERPDLVLTIPPEGTRALAPCWRSGFYQIAFAARVPIVLSSLDYARRVAAFGPVIVPSGDRRRDMEEIRAFYAGVKGRYPERFGEVRFEDEPRAEAEASAAPALSVRAGTSA